MVSFAISGIIAQRLSSPLVVDVIFEAENISIIPKLLPKGDYQSKRTHLCQSTATLRPPLSCRRRGSAQNFERSDSAAVAPPAPAEAAAEAAGWVQLIFEQLPFSGYAREADCSDPDKPLKKKKKRANFSGVAELKKKFNLLITCDAKLTQF